MEVIVLLVFILLFGSFGVASTVFWIWMLIDCASNEPSEGNDKIVWILVLVFTHLIGAILYFIVRRPKRQQLYGQ
jgi:hypothetical protein